jgi:DMSO/TMAO reductase YedYZ molybdopterin-dependent catalytic subunit
MKKSKIKLLIFIGIAIMLIISLIIYNNMIATKRLKDIEIRNYRGENLSSINSLRENSIKGVQYINITDYKLEISGLVEKPKNYSYQDILNKQSYEKIITLYCVEGWNVKILWKGILVRDLLDEVKPKEKANTIIFYAKDGYSTSFPLDYFYRNDIIMAYEMNNVTIPPERGYPFHLVAESKWGYKWAKWITKIEISNDTNYRGYWESRGYSNEGNLNQSFL